MDEAKVIRRILENFQKGTGQLLSKSKCSILFSEMCPPEIREEIKNTLGVVSSTFESKYLGLPTSEGRMKDEYF